MSFSRIPTPTLSRATARTASRCFRTDATGRIPLACDWRKLLQTVSQLETVAIQSRNAFARLVHLGQLPVLTWADDERAWDDAGTLRLRCANWGQAWGRIAVCPCCESPGLIEVLNAHGGEFFQLCALPGSEPAEWAGCLARLTSDDAIQGGDSPHALTGFSVLPAGTQRLAVTGAALPAFFSALKAESIRLRVLLHTPEMSQMREFVPHYVSTGQPLLTVNDLRTTVQVALPQVRGLCLAHDDSLHVTGRGDTLLVSFAPAGPADAAVWRIALQAWFPTARFKSTTS